MRTTFSRVSGMTADQRVALAEQFDKASRIATAEPVAVVGIGCRFPGGVVGPQSYWKLLTNGEDAISQVPADRWDAEEFYDPDPFAPGRMASKWGGFLADVAGFDADFFGISPREAEAMDPQQRVLLEVAFEALEHSGIVPDRLGGTRTAVMAGVYYTEYQSASVADPDGIDAYCATGNAHSITVGRIAYSLGLRGPAVAVDTACSSSLVAVHLACQSLRLRESDLALAGGVNLILRPETQLALSKWGMLSPRGRCHAFDAGADGFVRGEGAGMVVLKRLTDAVRDGDRVLAVVRGSAVNSDGRSNGLTAPNAPAQRDVITRALRSADVAASSVNFVETHGTGTALGDPIEFDALAAVYGRGDGQCALGAVKTNFGHLEAAAGIAGFIKAVLSVQRGHISPNLHFQQWNPAIDPAGTRLFVPTETAPWPDTDGPRRAAVSSFGIGGTNAHVVIEQGPEPGQVAQETGPPDKPAVSTLVVSGKSAARVASAAGMLADWMDAEGAAVGLADVAHTLNHHRARYGRGATVCARDRGQAVAGLRALAAGVPAPGVVLPHERRPGSGTVFVYSGQGSQWAGMGRALLADEPAFATAVADLEPTFIEQTGFSLQQMLSAGEAPVGIDRIQPVLVGMQLALTALWGSYGVEPDAVIGHSMGEVTAAVVAGALTTAQGLQVIATRSRLMSRLSGQGAMALVELDVAGCQELIAGYPDCAVAVHASPRQTVIAGPPQQVDAMVAVVDAQGRLARRVEVDVASHHQTVDPILPELRSALSGLAPSTPKIPLIGTTVHTGGKFDADYWVANLRTPVRFSEAVAAAGVDHGTFIEVSPHPLLTHALTESLEPVSSGRDTHVIATLNRDHDDTLTFHTQLTTVRPPSDEEAEPADGTGRLVDIPPTPWLHTKYWVANRVGTGLSGAHPLLGIHIEIPSGRDHVWQADVGTEPISWLADHKVHGQPVMPAAAFAEIALAAGSQALGLPATAIGVHRLDVDQMLPLDSHTQLTTQLIRHPDNVDSDSRVEIYSRSARGDWRRHAVARVDVATGDGPTRRADPPAEGGTLVSPADFYTALRRTGAQHGQAFAALTRIVRRPGGSSECEIVLPDQAALHRGYRIHPVMLDAALQGLAAAMPAESLTEAAESTYLPVSLGIIRVFGDVGRRARCYAELESLDDDGAGMLGRVTLTDDAGNPTAEISDVYLRRVQRRAVPLPLGQKLFDSVWVQAPDPADTAAPESASGSWLVLTHEPDAGNIAQEFIDRFASPTRRVLSADLCDESAVLEAFAETAAQAELPPTGVIIFVEGHPFEGTDAGGALARARDLVEAISTTVRAIVSGWHGTSPRLWLATRNGLAVDDGESGDPAIGALRGLIRVLAYEHPDLRASLVDVDAAGDAVAALTTELRSCGRDDVIAWRGERRAVERLVRATLGERKPGPVVRSDGSYIITGGLGGIGMVVAGWLADQGAGRIVLNGRSRPSEEQQKSLTDLEGRAEVAAVTGDISAPGVAERLVSAAEQTGLALRGVVHAAAVLDDKLVTTLSGESLEHVWTPKAAGALRLHEATASRQLDWWAGFSSAASLLGSPGQAAYACANAWLDALVAWRRASGLAAIAINWGQWADVGIARSLTLGVLDPITPAEGIEALEELLATDLTRVGVARLRVDRAAAAFPEIHQIGYFATLVEELDTVTDGQDWEGLDALRDADPAEASRIAIGRLRTRISAIMGYPESAIDADRPLTELGMDSLMAVRIRNVVGGDFGVEPSVALLLQGVTLADLTGDLLGQLGITGPDKAEAASTVRDRAQQRAAARRRAGFGRRGGR
jgi:phthiocerol/phenolphthiocerol synthesis type-I polyketide synthase D